MTDLKLKSLTQTAASQHPDLELTLREGERVGALMIMGFLQELNFKECGHLMMELVVIGSHGTDALDQTKAWFLANEPRAWKRFIQSVRQGRDQEAAKAEQKIHIPQA